MNLTENQWVVVALLCTCSLLLGWLSGSREHHADEEIVSAEEWHQHVQSALWVARRTRPTHDDTVPR